MWCRLQNSNILYGQLGTVGGADANNRVAGRNRIDRAWDLLIYQPMEFLKASTNRTHLPIQNTSNKISVLVLFFFFFLFKVGIRRTTVRTTVN